MTSPQISPSLPPGRLTMPTQGEEHFVIMTRDWRRIRSNVQSLKSHHRQYAAFAWVAVGTLVSAVLSAVAWYPTYHALPSKDRLGYAWIGPSMIAAGIGSLAIAAVMFWAAHNAKEEIEASATTVLKDMDDVPGAPDPAIESGGRDNL